MSEAHGLLLLAATPPLLAALASRDDSLDPATMRALFAAAGVSEKMVEAVLAGAGDAARDGWPLEGIERHDGHVLLHTFGDAWMDALEGLVDFGQGLELYARIEHEYGYTMLYAADGQGADRVGRIDFDSGYDARAAHETREAWLACVPASLRGRFADLFALELPGADSAGADTDAGDTGHAPWQPSSDDDHVIEIDGVLRVAGDLLDAGTYRRQHLQRALALGGQLVYPRGGTRPPRSQLHWILGSLEHGAARKAEIAGDMLELYPFELDLVCEGYGEGAGTALALAAGNGLLPVVERLLALGADPMPGSDECALDAARSALAVMPALDGECADFDPDERNEGTIEDYRAIIALLQARG